jgi:D-alanyl-D-alanine carboxypeptidase
MVTRIVGSPTRLTVPLAVRTVSGWRDTPCGVRVYGNDGDALAYQAYSFSTHDRRQVTVAVTPNFDGDIDDAVTAFVDSVICG